MTERITLRAKSDGTEFSGDLDNVWSYSWDVSLAPDTRCVTFYRAEWERVYALPTAVGTVFRATVGDVENERLVVVDPSDHEPGYLSTSRVDGFLWADPHQIDASTVVIELEGGKK